MMSKCTLNYQNNMFQSAFDNSEPRKINVGGAVSRILVNVHSVYVSKKGTVQNLFFLGFMDVEMNG